MSANEIPDQIEIDGVRRPTRNSKGELIHATPEGIEAFWKWFGDSGMVDKKGRPLVVYHGTKVKFDAFDLGEDARGVGAWWFSNSGSYSEDYFAANDGGYVLRLYLRVMNPKTIDVLQEANKQAAECGDEHIDDMQAAQEYLAGHMGWDAYVSWHVQSAQDSGHDGLIITSFMDGRASATHAYLAWDATSIKSAVPAEACTWEEYLESRDIEEKNGKLRLKIGAFELHRHQVQRDWERENELRDAIGSNGIFNPSDPRIRHAEQEAVVPPARRRTPGMGR